VPRVLMGPRAVGFHGELNAARVARRFEPGDRRGADVQCRPVPGDLERGIGNRPPPVRELRPCADVHRVVVQIRLWLRPRTAAVDINCGLYTAGGVVPLYRDVGSVRLELATLGRCALAATTTAAAVKTRIRLVNAFVKFMICSLYVGRRRRLLYARLEEQRGCQRHAACREPGK
jgi:hypothetical protein